MKTALLVTSCTVLGVGALLLILRTVFRSLRRSMEREIARRFQGRRIVMQAPFANFFGVKSKGYRQIRGNGALVLTDEELWFLRAVPRMETSIPVQRVTGASLKRVHLRKTIFRPLLYVEFEGDDGPDSVAWYVSDPELWIKAIETARGQKAST